MKRLQLLTIAMLFFVSAGLAAADWSVWGISLARQDKTDEGLALYQLSDQAGHAFTLTADRDPDAELVRKIGETVKHLYDWPELVVKSLQFFYQEGQFRAMVLPEKFMVGGEDVTRYMPAGLTFFYTDQLSYDFRMVKDTVSMKVSGVFANRSEFLLTVDNAVKNPLAFASRSNHMARIDEMERRLNRLLYQHHDLQERYEKAVTALLYYRNTGFLRGPRVVPAAVVLRVVQLKRQNPKLNAEQILLKLEQEKVQASKKEVRLILDVYFNDFGK